jgi:urease accessory protein
MRSDIMENHRMATLTRFATLALIAAPGAALAHTGIGSVHGFSAGLLHPLGGFDHVLAMVAIGLWAGASGGAMRWALPTAFLAGMAGGGVLGMAGLGMPMVEAGILASLIVLGALVASGVRASALVALPMALLFGSLHGHAHGSEGMVSMGYAAGFMLATAALHGLGLALNQGAGARAVRLAGGAAACAGLALLLAGG